MKNWKMKSNGEVDDSARLDVDHELPAEGEESQSTASDA